MQSFTARLLIGLLSIGSLWVAGKGGAQSSQHWAYIPPQRPALPGVRNAAWPRNPLDYFVLSRLESAGLSPSEQASAATLARRITLDLIGLPPELVDLDAYRSDRSPNAYDRLAARLLDDPHFGERMAQHWLDAARFADTHGYLIDAHREMWRWRDWVIAAFNQNMPFDQFTIEQLAGDLLPLATVSQRVASGFNRNHMINNENGAIAEQYRTEYVADRVVTVGTVWLGQTLDCARCHDHKYDPISMREFYQLFAFFNNVPEEGLDGNRGNAVPTIAAPTDPQLLRWNSWQERIEQLRQQQLSRRHSATADLKDWETETRARNRRVHVDALLKLTFDSLENQSVSVETNGRASLPAVARGMPLLAPGKIGQALLLDGTSFVELPTRAEQQALEEFSITVWLYPTTNDRMVIASFDDAGSQQQLQILLDDCHVELTVHDQANHSFKAVSQSTLVLRRWQQLTITYRKQAPGELTVYRDGQLLKMTTEQHFPLLTINPARPGTVGGQAEAPGWRGMLDEFSLFAQVLTEAEIRVLAAGVGIEKLVAIPRSQRTADQQLLIDDFYLNQYDRQYRALTSELSSLQRQLALEEQSAPTVMVMQDAKPRDTFVLTNAQFDQPGEQVRAATPAVLHAWPKDAPRNRLGLAKWLVDKKNPLTARVVVNRLWMQFFGEGLVRTPEDFGVRGEPPTNPELLDWLAVELMTSGWDIKHMVHLIVTSATYRQSSRMRSDGAQADPENRHWGRAPRIRMDAETIRDAALSVSGLLDQRVGGASVFPYQPDGLWEEVSFNPAEYSAQTYKQSRGSDLYRRSIYTFWKRTLPPPSMSIFDAPTREQCTVSRTRTNTPQQALVLMNEPGMIEAARQLAVQILVEGGPDPRSRVRWAFRRVTSRSPDQDEVETVTTLYRGQLALFLGTPDQAAQLVSVGDSTPDTRFNVSDLAAWTVVANVLLSLDEVITRN